MLRSEWWILRNRSQILGNESQALRCHHHRVCTEEVNKIVLNSNNDKRIQTYPHRTNAFKVCENETRYVILKRKTQAPGSDLQILRSVSYILRNKSRIPRYDTQALRNESRILRNELKALRSESEILRNKSQILRNESQAVRSESLTCKK